MRKNLFEAIGVIAFALVFSLGLVGLARLGDRAVVTPAQAQFNNPQYPAGAIPVTNSATGTTGAVLATLPASQGRTTWLCGFSFFGTNATAANAATAVTVTGTLGGTLTFGYTTLVAGAAVPDRPPLFIDFNPCIAASAVNTAIVVNGPALGAGATLATTAAWGYQTLQ